ncbi:MAG: Ig-like domain-containing protein, partial [Clostridia bacterium]|nr:Ig-like domain-containing protein [Clostridia bacterium]
MSGYDLFTALGQISDKTAAHTVARSKKAKTREAAGRFLKAAAVAASAVLIIGFAVFMWYFAQKMKDPPIEPAVSDTETQTKSEDTQPEQQEGYVQKLTKAIEEYFSQNYEKNVVNINGDPQITITTLNVKPNEGWGQFYGGIYVYAASKIERHGVEGYVGEGDAQYGLLSDETKYFAFAAEADMQFTSNIDVEQVGDYLFRYGSGMRVSVVIGDRYYYGLKEAYEAGVIDDDDLYAASLMFGKDSAIISYSAIRCNGVTTRLNAERVNGMCMIPFVRLMDSMFGVSEESVGRYTFEFKGRKYYINVIDPAAGDAETGADYLLAALEEKGEEHFDDIVGGRLNFRHEEMHIEESILKRFFELAGIEATVQDPDVYDGINILIDLSGSTKVNVESIYIYSPSFLIEVGESMKLTAAVSPENALDKTVNWSVGSGAEYVQTAQDGDGFTVTGVKPGVCYIKASASDGSGVSASVRITVVGSLQESKTEDLIEEYIRCKIAAGNESKAEKIVNVLITGGDERHAEAASYCAGRYYGEADPAVRMCLSRLFSRVAESDIFSIPVKYPLNYTDFVSKHLQRTEGTNYLQENDYMNYSDT